MSGKEKCRQICLKRQCTMWQYRMEETNSGGSVKHFCATVKHPVPEHLTRPRLGAVVGLEPCEEFAKDKKEPCKTDSAPYSVDVRYVPPSIKPCKYTNCLRCAKLFPNFRIPFLKDNTITSYVSNSGKYRVCSRKCEAVRKYNAGRDFVSGEVCGSCFRLRAQVVPGIT